MAQVAPLVQKETRQPLLTQQHAPLIKHKHNVCKRWRVSFVFIALVSFVLALALVIGIEEPQRSREPATPSLSRYL